MNNKVVVNVQSLNPENLNNAVKLLSLLVRDTTDAICQKNNLVPLTDEELEEINKRVFEAIFPTKNEK